jgi:transketolase C-terminal domain/subunit
VRTGTAGYIVSFGDALYRAIDAAERLKQQGIDVGVINKSTLNIIDEDMMTVRSFPLTVSYSMTQHLNH